MLQLQPHPEGFTLAVRVQPGAKQDAILGAYADGIKVSLTAPALDGRANLALIDFLRITFGLKRAQVDIIVGHKSRNKRILFRDVPLEVLVNSLITLGLNSH